MSALQSQPWKGAADPLAEMFKRNVQISPLSVEQGGMGGYAPGTEPTLNPATFGYQVGKNPLIDALRRNIKITPPSIDWTGTLSGRPLR